MEADEMIWVDIGHNACVAPGPADGKQLHCMHYLLNEDGHRYCGGAKSTAGGCRAKTNRASWSTNRSTRYGD